MTWTIINLILLVAGICLIGYGKHIDSSENTEALLYFIFGFVLLVVLVISEPLRWWLG